MSRFPLEDLQFKKSSVYRLGSKRRGRVFKGTFKSEPVAVKTFPLKRDVHQHEQHWKKLVHLTHDHLVQYRQFSLQENAWCLVMELCQGSMVDYCRQTLDQSVASHVKGIDIMWQIAHGIDYLHRQQICPGDLKLENVLFRKRNPESRLVFVKLTGYGYSNNHFEDDANFYLSQLGRLFYSAATKEEAEPKGPISLDSLTEIDVDHRDLALDLISLLVSESFSDGIEAGTVLRHPLFTRCTNEGRSRLKEDLKNEKEWNSERVIQDWRDSLDERKSDFSGEVFDDFKEILLENKDIASLVDKAFRTTPKMVSEYIWHIAITSRSGLKGNYQTKLIEKQEVLGTGTYGKVYKCDYTDGNGNRFPAAMKKCKHNRNAEMEEEIKTLRQLSHLFVVKYLDVVKENSKKFIVMELCEGSLMDYVEGKLQRIPKDSLDDKIIISQIALGLAYIHDKGIIHKDLNLKNILLKFQSERLVLAKIAYFGFAKELKPGTDEFSKTKRPGTENYMAPELLKAPDDAYPATFASDVYALGITIAQLVGKGKHPFSSNSITRRFSMISGLTPPNLKGPWDLIDLILKLIEEDPSKRPEMALVLRHPYFVLTNDKTKRHFVDQLWTGLKLLPKKERQNVVKEIFNNKNFQEWYHKLCDSKPDTVEKMETMAKTLQVFSSDIWAESLSAAEEYDEAIKGAITSDYDENVGSQINQMNSFQGLFRGISRYRLYKLVERAPKLLVPYFWLHLLDVSGKAISFRNPTSPRKRRFSSESIGHSTISELEWSSLYFNDEEDIDELWNIKYSENYENCPESIQEIIRTVAKCNVSERVWSALLRNMETTTAAEILYEVVQSNTRHAAKVTEMILQRCDASDKEKLSPVHILVASYEGECAAGIMRVLLNHGVHPKNAVSKVGMTPVHYAAQNESSSGPELMQLLLEKGGDPNTCSITLEKSTPVHWAASNQGEYAAEILKLLLDRGGKCDALVGSLEPIHLATMNNGESAPELLDLLLRERGINVVHENTGMSLVHFTMFNNGDGGPKIANKLLEKGAEPNARDRRKQTPLHLAAKDTTGENSQIPIMAELLKNGGDPNAVDELGRTPVHYAAANEGEHAHEKLKLLLTHGGKLAVFDKGELTPIHYTILNKGTSGAEMRELVSGVEEKTNLPLNESGETLLHRLVNGIGSQIHLVRMALDNGENPNAKDSRGWSPVHVAVATNSLGLDILKLLLEKGGDANLADSENLYTPVHYAASGLEECGQMEVLLGHGGDANAVGIDGLTPLHLVAMNSGTDSPRLARILLEHGGDPNLTDDFKRTSVHVAVLNENIRLAFDTTRQLLEKGGDPNAGDEKGSTPVHYTVFDERKEMNKVTKLLIQHGGDMFKKDNRGMTPYSLATQMGKQFSLTEFQ